MRLLVLLLSLFGSSAAHAEARLKLRSERPVVIVVNMVPHTVGDDAATVITLRDGREGNQRVMVRNLVGQELWQGTLMVKRNTVTTARWQNRELVITDETPLKTSSPFNRGNYGPSTLTGGGSRELNDLADDSGKFDEEQHLLDLVAAQSTPSPLHGTADTTTADTTTADTTGESQPVTTASFDGEVRMLVPQGTGATLTLISRERSWSNVWLDGKLAWEFRGKSSGLRLYLTPGTHTLEFKDFQDKKTWAAGTVQTAPDAPVEIRFGMATGAEAFETPDAWAPNK